MRKQVRVLYSGRVQGVGFRFSAKHIADGLSIDGWVRNLPDGKVEIAAEADEGALKTFLDKVHSYFSSYIRDATSEWSPATGEYNNFQIRF